MQTKIIHNIPKFRERRKELRRNSTEQEKILWQELRGNKLGYKFRRQHSIGGYITDFYCAECRLVIEIDGGVHSDSESKKYDIQRDLFLKSLNHTVLRFKNSRVEKHLNDTLVIILKTLIHLSHPSPKLGEGAKRVR